MDLALSPEEEAFAASARDWLEANVEVPPVFRTVEDEMQWGRRWQARCAADRWVGIAWPERVGGRGASPVEVALFNVEYGRAGAAQPVNRVGINLAGPTLLAFGTEAQQKRWLPAILDASELWCQMFSEPDAGSDLASLRTVAEPVEGGWRLTGQKVWTSYARFARWGIVLARTDPEAPRHGGISYFVVDLEADGVDVRPLRQITGETEFNEVFLEGAFVPDDALVGDLHDGWRVASTTLAHERGTNFPFKEQVVHEIHLDHLLALADARGALDDVAVADGLAQAFVRLRILRDHNWRTLSRLGRGEEPGPESSVVKLAWSELTQGLSAAALDVLGDDAVLWPDPGDGDADAAPAGGASWQRQWLWSKAASIAGGTSEIQRTILAERLLGLPRAPS